jgi:hypothetical protein
MIKLCTSIFSRPLLTSLPELIIKRAVLPPEYPSGLTRALDVGNSRMVSAVTSEIVPRIHSGCFVLVTQRYRYETASNMLHFTLQVSKLHLQMLKVIHTQR